MKILAASCRGDRALPNEPAYRAAQNAGYLLRDFKGTRPE